MINRKKNIKQTKVAALGAVLELAQLGQTVGAMMPDNDVGSALKGVLDPLTNTGAAISYMTEGNFGKGLLSLIPGVGTYMKHTDKEAFEQEQKELTRKKTNAAYANYMKTESNTELMTRNNNNGISLFSGGGVMTKDSPLSPKGGATIQPTSGKQLSGNAIEVTTPNGSSQGSHENGNNIPIINKGKDTNVVTEPGEVIVNTPEMAIILSKRNGLAQQYKTILSKKDKLNTMLTTAKTAEAKAGLMRNIEYFDTKLQDIVAQQEALSTQLADMSAAQNQPQQAAGGGYIYKDGQLVPAINESVNPENPYGTIATLNRLQSKSEFDDSPFTTINKTFDMLPNNTSLDTVPTIETDGTQQINLGATIDKIKNALPAINDIAGKILPSVMNYKNQTLMEKSIEEVNNYTPIQQKINYSKSDFKVGDIEARIDSNYANNVNVANRVSNPLHATAILANAGADRAEQINNMVGEKQRMDEQATQQQVNNINSINNANLNSINATRQLQLETKLSANNAMINLNNTTVDNVYAMIKDKNVSENDKLNLKLIVDQYNQYGRITRYYADFLKKHGIEVPEENIDN